MTTNVEYFIPQQLDDTVQCLKFIPVANSNYLAAGGWDCKLRVFNINYSIINQNTPSEDAQISANLEFGNQHNSQIFSLSWEGSTGRIFTGCADGSVNYLDMQKNNLTTLGRHKNPCKEVIFHQNYNILLLLLVSPNVKDLGETISTLQFGERIVKICHHKIGKEKIQFLNPSK